MPKHISFHQEMELRFVRQVLAALLPGFRLWSWKTSAELFWSLKICSEWSNENWCFRFSNKILFSVFFDQNTIRSFGRWSSSILSCMVTLELIVRVVECPTLKPNLFLIHFRRWISFVELISALILMHQWMKCFRNKLGLAILQYIRTSKWLSFYSCISASKTTTLNNSWC